MELFCENWGNLVTIDNKLNPFQKILKDSTEACLPYDALISKLRKQNPWMEGGGRQPFELVIIELMKRSDALQTKINNISQENAYLRVEHKRLVRENNEQAKSLHDVVAENSKLLVELKNVLSNLSIRKPPQEEIAELQERIMGLYANKN